GQSVTVKAENGSARAKGKITFVSAQGEFTPKNIQTEEQRATQVFAAKVSLLEMKQAEFKPGQTVVVHID
ncbi:MAG TPA: ABC transporter substrate-binding protein, partial [Bacillota bacterium]|nr:ABC transporter substrate-binding protein [Bacillota bacterium]